MNGFTLAAGLLTLSCGAGPMVGDLSQTGPPGTGRTVLVIPDWMDLNIRQVPGRNGPVVRIETGRWPVRAPFVRFEHQGCLFDVFATPKDFSVTQYPRDGRNPPRPRPIR